MGWQKASGYNWRALVEADVSRWKRVVGDGLRFQTDGRQATEVAIAAEVLNRMLDLGRPNYVRIACPGTRVGINAPTPSTHATEWHPNQITAWKAQLLDGAAGAFGSGPATTEVASAVDVKVLHAKIGELTLENDFLSGALSKAGLLSAKR